MLCDQILGLKDMSDDKGQVITITPSLLPIGLRKLSSFIINYYNYLDSNSKKVEIMGRLNSIIDRISIDKKYEYLKKRNDLNSKSEMLKLYYAYLTESFNLLVDFNFYLQTTIMAGTKDVKSLLRWKDSKPLFDNLSDTRREVSVILANYSFVKCHKAFNKVISYYYTYGLFMDIKERVIVDELVKIGVEYLTRKDILNFMDDVKNDRDRSEIVLKKRSMYVQNLINHIYLFTNESLSYVGVLPKIERREYFDKTGI